MEIKRLSVLNCDEIKQYAHLINDQNFFWPHRDLHILCFMALDETKPVGLLLGSATESFYLAEIHSLFVKKKYRNQNIEAKLLQCFEKELMEHQCKMVTCFYSDAMETKLELEKLLNNNKFNPPIPTIIRYYFKGADFAPNWMNKNYQYPKDFSVSYFKDLSEEERKELMRRVSQGSIPNEVSPFLNEEVVEPINSLILKDQEKIIGFVITHRVSETLIRYSSLYIESEYQHLGYSIQLLINSMKIQKQIISENHPAILAVFDLNLNQTDKNWQHFIKRRLSSHADKTEVINLAWKELC